MKINKVENIVKDILRIYPSSRDDDFILIDIVLQYLEVNEFNDSFHYVMMKHKELKLPSFESITRARRKLQNEYPELRSNKEIERLRLQKEVEIYNYSKGE